jgi:hypothetical protein
MQYLGLTLQIREYIRSRCVLRLALKHARLQRCVTQSVPISQTKSNFESPTTSRFTTGSPHLQIQGTSSIGGVALAAMQHLLYPLMVLDNQKTLVIADEAMRRLLDIETTRRHQFGGSSEARH